MPLREKRNKREFDRLRLSADNRLDGALQIGDLGRRVETDDNLLALNAGLVKYPISHHLPGRPPRPNISYKIIDAGRIKNFAKDVGCDPPDVWNCGAFANLL